MDSTTISPKFSDEQIQILESFIGYGNPNSKYIFIGIEEAGDINYCMKRLEFYEEHNQLEYLDLKDFHIFKDGENDLFSREMKASIQCKQLIWNFICYLIFRLEGKSEKEIKKDRNWLIREYINQKLGSINNGETLLADIYPIPFKKDKKFPEEYRNSFGYESKKSYREKILPTRIKAFKKLLGSRNGKIVICYGERYWPEYIKFFKGFDIEFKDHCCFKIGVNQKNGSIFCLTPFLGQGHMSYKKMDTLISLIQRKG